MQDLKDTYTNARTDSANRYAVAMNSARTTHDSDVQSANDTYDNRVADLQFTRANAERQSHNTFANAEQSAANAYRATEQNFWDSWDMTAMMFDDSILNQAGKDYQVALAEVNVPLADALGDAAITYVSDERPADTTRVRKINKAHHDLSVADATASYDQAIRDVDALETYWNDSAEREGRYDIDVKMKGRGDMIST